jgi:hypothetical protein
MRVKTHLFSIGLLLFLGSNVLNAGAANEMPVQLSDLRTVAKLDVEPTNLRLNSKGNLLAFNQEGALGLRVVDLKSGKVFEPSGYFVGAAFFWSPDGARLIFREIRSQDGQISSWLRAWDMSAGKNTEIENFAGMSGLPTFDPRDNRWMVIYDKGVKSKKLVFPGNRLASWQAGQRRDFGKWAMAPKGAAFITESGFNMRKLEDDGSGIESFDISPDGSTAVWATVAGKIYASTDGEKPQFVDWGRDPKWHPERMLIVYAGGRMVGNKAADYDIKIASLGSKGSFLTATQHIAERWPNWSRDGKRILFTSIGGKEIQEMPFQQSAPVIAMPVPADVNAVTR